MDTHVGNQIPGISSGQSEQRFLDWQISVAKPPVAPSPGPSGQPRGDVGCQLADQQVEAEIDPSPRSAKPRLSRVPPPFDGKTVFRRIRAIPSNGPITGM